MRICTRGLALLAAAVILLTVCEAAMAERPPSRSQRAVTSRSQRAVTSRSQRAVTSRSQRAVRVARVIRDEAVFRVGPTTDHDRRTPLQRGVRLRIVGRCGEWLEVDLGSGDRGWVREDDVAWESSARCEPALLRNVLVRPRTGETWIDIQLTARTSFDLVEELDPPAMVVRLHQTVSAVHELAQYEDDPLVLPATLRQTAPQTVTLRFPLVRRGAWGYRVSYGVSANVPGDPRGHDFSPIAGETLRIALAHPPDLVTPVTSATGSQSLAGVTVVVDPGHGGSDPGAVGAEDTREKDVNLAVSRALRAALEKRGALVVMTRDADVDVASRPQDELAQRVEVGRTARGALFVSVHHNARPRVEDGRVATGTFVYYYQPWSAALARAVAGPLAEAENQRVHAYVFRSFAVTRQTFMPSILLEGTFISNPDEERRMRSPDYAQRVGEAVAQGLEKYFMERGAGP